jgi:hypothetical protein
MRTEIMSEVDVAQRFYRYGMVLKQHANFYNNISTEMVPSQKPMMLKDAVDFEKVCMLEYCSYNAAAKMLQLQCCTIKPSAHAYH